MISVTFCLAKSRHFYHILLYMSMCIFVCIFYINNTAKGNTSLMLNKLLHISFVLLVWRDRVKRLDTDRVVMCSSPATGHIRCALLVNQPKYVKFTFVVVSLFI